MDAAEVRGSEARADYVKVAQFMQRREPAGYAAVRLLTPAHFQPHVLAGYAFASFTDDLCDHGTVSERMRRFDAWARQIRAALDSGTARHPLLRAFLYTSSLRDLPRHWIESYLDGARIDLDFPGFATEADYQAYVDQLTWPFLMITTGLAQQGGGSPEFAQSCRLVADAGQRTDILTDLAEDLRDGRLYLPLDALAQHGVDRADLAAGRNVPGVRTLLSEAADKAHATLREASRLLDELPDEYGPLMRFVLDLHHQRLQTVVTMGPAVTRRPARDNPLTCLRLLARARRPRGTGRPAPQPRPSAGNAADAERIVA
ncbi:squalene/phytoene synthase family protein [Streptomyces sp. NPDC050315]|uniref:phytoene/squalene synthase family protein n=1 Tax=Streptomyces sp. NPDC050315 TaxID=3155039 RepID=UPI00342CFACA